MQFAIRKRYLRIWLPVVLALLLLAFLLLWSSGFGFRYQFQEPVEASTLTLSGLEGGYFRVPVETLAPQSFAYFGYEDEEGNTEIEDRYCFLLVEGKYLTVRVTRAFVPLLTRYDEAGEMIASGELGSMLELQFDDVTGTVSAGLDETVDTLLRECIASQHISELTDTVSGADLSGYAGAAEGDYSAYLDEAVLPLTMTTGYWGPKPVSAVRSLTGFALAFALLALALLLTIPLGLWERPYRLACRRWGKAELQADYRQARHFGKSFAMGEAYLWWFRPLDTRIMRAEDVVWAYPRSLRLEGGKKSWSLVLKTTEREEWGVRLGEAAIVQQATEALQQKGHPLATGFSQEKQTLFEKDLTTFRARAKNGNI